MKECTQSCFPFAPHFSREVVARFDGGRITTEAGALLLRPVEQRTGILRQFAACFRDYRRAERVEHTVSELVRQRVYGIALGYEDLNDHDNLRGDPLWQCAVERGDELASGPTLCRLEGRSDRCTALAMSRVFVGGFIDSFALAPAELVLDFDATGDRVHGCQEGRFFHGYYGDWCCLPLYVFCGDRLLVSYLRPSNIDAACHA